MPITEIFLLFLPLLIFFDPAFSKCTVLPLRTIICEYENKYLHDLNGSAISFSAHSSFTSIVSCTWSNSFAVVRYLFACSMSYLVYSGMIVFIIFQKYSLSGTRPYGNFAGKYFMNSSSSFIWGQKLSTDSSSYLGTFTRLTSLSFSSFFDPVRTSFKKSLFILILLEQIMKYKLTCTPVANKVGVVLWSI